jgi:hypothetical protein
MNRKNFLGAALALVPVAHVVAKGLTHDASPELPPSPSPPITPEPAAAPVMPPPVVVATFNPCDPLGQRRGR